MNTTFLETTVFLCVCSPDSEQIHLAQSAADDQRRRAKREFFSSPSTSSGLVFRFVSATCECVVGPSPNEHVITYIIITRETWHGTLGTSSASAADNVRALDETDRQNNETGHFKPSAFGPESIRTRALDTRARLRLRTFIGTLLSPSGVRSRRERA